MEIKQQKPDTILVWTREQSSNQRFAKEETLEKQSAKHRSQKNDQHKDTPEEMIRALQSIFCRGRYQSWLSYQSRHRR